MFSQIKAPQTESPRGPDSPTGSREVATSRWSAGVVVVVDVLITANSQTIDQFIHEGPAEHGVGDEIHIVANT